MASTLWKGFLSFGMISVPVRLYAAARPETISFHMLHRACNTRVRQQLWCPVDEVVIDRKDTVKGYEIDDGRWVVVEPSDLEKIEPPAARTIDVLEFVPQDELDPVWLDASYWMVADEAGEKAYRLLAQVLAELRLDGVARLVMHQREHIVIVRPSDGGLMLHTAFHADEVRKVEGWGESKDASPLDERELEMGRMFVKALQGRFDPSRYPDRYRQSVRRMIEEKVKGEAVTEAPKAAPVPVYDLMAALKASLQNLPAKDGEPSKVSSPDEAAPAGARKGASRSSGRAPHEDFKPRARPRAPAARTRR